MVTITAMYLESVAENSSLDPQMFRTQWLKLMHHNVMLDHFDCHNEMLHGKEAQNLFSILIPQ